MRLLAICAVLLAIFNGQKLFAQDDLGFLSQEEINTFYEQGFVIKKGAFDRTQLQTMDEITTKFIDTARDEIAKEIYPYSDMEQITYINGTQIVFIKVQGKTPSIYRVVGCAGIEPKVLEILRSEKMTHTFFNLLGCDQIEHIICQFHPKLPNDGVYFPQHRDIQYRKHLDPSWKDILGNGSYAICTIAVDPCFLENGTLLIDKNSYPSPRGPEENIVVVTMEPGDMLFMHPEILHWSGPNRSEISRRTLLTGFCAFGANHKMYPGSDVNECLTKSDCGFEIAPAPWKILTEDPLAWTYEDGENIRRADH